MKSIGKDKGLGKYHLGTHYSPEYGGNLTAIIPPFVVELMQFETCKDVDPLIRMLCELRRDMKPTPIPEVFKRVIEENR